MSLTRKMDSPLLSEDEALRRASLMQLIHAPTTEGAKALIQALLHFLRERPAVAAEFEHVLYTPPLGPLAEGPLLQLLDEEDEAVREEGAFILYKLKLRASSRARMAQALTGDESPWVRAYAAKALAMLPGSGAAPLIAEAIDNEATLEAIGRMGEALALAGDPASATVLRDQAEQLRERSAPASASQPEQWAKAAGHIALLLEALAAKLEGEAPEGKLEDWGAAFRFTHPEHGAVLVGGGVAHGGYTARVGERREVLDFDSETAHRAFDGLVL
jgi:hypothetical protein